ncbi:hypothetical protein SH528x_000446 [Novipirellula sp. SH528]|uniref:hypothetical protein n=1 Tax=Novipirellula sp. SH528 TaxID=3454466 RepID=UPI003F9FA07B
MSSNKKIAEEVERQLRAYVDLRTQMNLPPLTDQEQSRQRIMARETRRIANEARRQDQLQQQEQARKRLRDVWQYRVLATHEDITIIGKQGDVFSQTNDGDQYLLPAPHFPWELNELDEYLDLNKVSKPIVLAGDGRPWTRHPEIAFFSDDGSRLTVHWIASPHEVESGMEMINGWQKSLGIVQRVTWAKGTSEGRLSWHWLETIERSAFHSWERSMEQWTSQCRP